MKTLLLATALLISSSTLFLSAQYVIVRSDSTEHHNEQILLHVNEYRGTLQWQVSHNGISWKNIPGQPGDTLIVHADSSAYYRAGITEGSCDPVYSDTTLITRMFDTTYEAALIKKQIAMFEKQEVKQIQIEKDDIINSYFDETIDDSIYIYQAPEEEDIEIGDWIVDTADFGKLYFVYDTTELKLLGELVKLVSPALDTRFKDEEIRHGGQFNRTKKASTYPRKFEATISDRVEMEGISFHKGPVQINWENDTFLIAIKDLTLYENKEYDLSFVLENASITYRPSLDFYARFDPVVLAASKLTNIYPGAMIKNLLVDPEYAVLGEIKKMTVVTYNDLDFDASLRFHTSVEELELIKDSVRLGKLNKNIIIPTAIPIVISLQTELWAKVRIHFDGSLDVHPQMHAEYDVMLGFETEKIGNDYKTDPVYSLESRDSGSFDIEGHAGITGRFEIVPRVEVYVYKVFGPSVELIPYVNTYAGVGLEQAYINWEGNLGIGIDGRISADLSGFHSDKATLELIDFPIEGPYYEVFSIPDGLFKISGDNQNGDRNSTLDNPLVVEVRDNLGNPVKGVNVYFNAVSGDATFVDDVIKTDELGRTEAWVVLGNDSNYEIQAVIKDSHNEPREDGMVTFNLQAKDSTDPGDISEGLIAHYPLDGNTLDAAMNNRDAVSLGAAPAEDRFGNPDACYDFDGINDYIEVQSKLPIDGFPLSVSLWVNIDSYTDGTGEVFASDRWDHYWGSYHGFIINVAEGGYVGVGYANSLNTSTNVLSTAENAVNTGSWYHITAVFANEDDTKIYINGVQQSTTESNPQNNLVAFTPAKDRIGRAYDGIDRHLFDGRIDEVRLYDRVLTQDEITTLFNEDGWSGNGDPETGILNDSRDGNSYKWIKTGSQVWMAENLKYLPGVNPSSDGSDTEAYYYVYGYEGTNIVDAKSNTNYETYGVLYNWPSALNACPSGWHLPSDEEWMELESTLGLSSELLTEQGTRGTTEGQKLKSISGWNNSGNGSNAVGFNALPAGHRNSTTYAFGEMGNLADFWTSTENNPGHAWRRRLTYNSDQIARNRYSLIKDGRSVRCVRDY